MRPGDQIPVETRVSSKLNSNPSHYKLNFPLRSKQKSNSKFEELGTAQTHKVPKKLTKFGRFFCILSVWVV